MQFKKIGVIGGGTMGQGIAEMLAGKGLEVVLVEKSQEKLDHAWEMLNYALDKQLEKWAITETEKKLLLAKIHTTLDISEVAGCQMVIETIVEDMEAKKAVFRELDWICRAPIILASNTSTLSITELAEVCKPVAWHPGMMCGCRVSKQFLPQRKEKGCSLLALNSFIEWRGP